MSIIFIKVMITDNHGSSLCLLSSKVIFNGDTQILRNVGMSGGGLSSKDSFLIFTGSTWFDGNTAQAGGAINSIQGEIAFRSTVLFTNNTADSDGGAIYAEGSNIILKKRTEFCSNSALNGGATYLSKATLTHTCSTMLNTSKNHAFEFGGAIYHEDSPWLRSATSEPMIVIDEMISSCPSQGAFCSLQRQDAMAIYNLIMTLLGKMDTFCIVVC